MAFLWRAAAVLIAIGALNGLPARADSAVAAGSAVPADRLALLARGINFSAWFGPNAEPLQLGSWITDEDCRLLKRLGFTFVRLPSAPKWLFNTSDPTHPPDAIRYYDHAVRTILDAGLAVIVDPIHGTSSDDAFEDSLARDPAFQRAVEAGWQQLARRYAAYAPNRVFFEIMNEPHISTREKIDPGWWAGVQQRLAAAIRRAAPHSTIIATGEKWGGIDGLLALTPLADPDVVYSFHWYDPFTFTHQGAEWTDDVQKMLSGIPYPSSPQAVAGALAGLTDPRAKKRVEAYGRDDWNADRIQAELQKAADWGKKNGVPVFCGEFGVYRKVAPAADRVHWISDVRFALDKLGIGWSMWDYDGGFGLVRYSSPGRRAGRILDARVAAALALSAPPTSGPDVNEIVIDQDPVAGFLDGKVPSVSVPVAMWPRLFSRDRAAAEVTSVEDIALKPITLILKHSGPLDWSQASGLRVPVKEGERFTLSGTVSVQALPVQSGDAAAAAKPGTASLEVTTYDSDGKVVKWNLGAKSASPAGGGSDASTLQPLATTFVVGPGVAAIEPRWSGSGPALVRLGPLQLSRESGS